uniref:IST1 homolog protein, putative n=1 Tax=Neospora caninum (strain Liverpool) TaxID=572307 RepID=A0A0F7UF75_NEOCL|nr:TPA: IST1 homolog protein, putative [Neospora caninum Liverpool]
MKNRFFISFLPHGREGKSVGWPFKKFDPVACKSSLKMAMSRARMNQNRLQNSIRIQRSEIAALISEGKEERARLKAEHMLRECRVERAMDILYTLCELIVTRMNYLTSEKCCPSDLLSAVHSVLYCEPRLNIDELKTVRRQFTIKYGQLFVEEAVKNDKQEAHFKLVHSLSLTQPVELEILEVLKSVAEEYGVTTRLLESHAEQKGSSPKSVVFLPRPSSACLSYSPLQQDIPPFPPAQAVQNQCGIDGQPHPVRASSSSYGKFLSLPPSEEPDSTQNCPGLKPDQSLCLPAPSEPLREKSRHAPFSSTDVSSFFYRPAVPHEGKTVPDVSTPPQKHGMLCRQKSTAAVAFPSLAPPPPYPGTPRERLQEETRTGVTIGPPGTLEKSRRIKGSDQRCFLFLPPREAQKGTSLSTRNARVFWRNDTRTPS